MAGKRVTALLARGRSPASARGGRAAGAAAFFMAAGLLLSGGVAAPGEAEPGTIQGIVTLDGWVRYAGTAPAGTPVDMGGDAYCEGANRDRPLLRRMVVVNAQGGLANVVIHLKEGVPRASRPVPQDPVLLDQRDCAYVPGTVALRTGQPLLIRNSDATLHNVHVRARNNREFNIGQPIRGIESRRTFARPEVGMAVTCDIHGWMDASIAVFDHPWFAVSGQDGSFSLGDVPPGEYVVEAWHATLGARTQRVTVRAGQAAEMSFTFEAG